MQTYLLSSPRIFFFSLARYWYSCLVSTALNVSTGQYLCEFSNWKLATISKESSDLNSRLVRMPQANATFLPLTNIFSFSSSFANCSKRRPSCCRRGVRGDTRDVASITASPFSKRKQRMSRAIITQNQFVGHFLNSCRREGRVIASVQHSFAASCEAYILLRWKRQVARVSRKSVQRKEVGEIMLRDEIRESEVLGVLSQTGNQSRVLVLCFLFEAIIKGQSEPSKKLSRKENSSQTSIISIIYSRLFQF